MLNLASADQRAGSLGASSNGAASFANNGQNSSTGGGLKAVCKGKLSRRKKTYNGSSEDASKSSSGASHSDQFADGKLASAAAKTESTVVDERIAHIEQLSSHDGLGGLLAGQLLRNLEDVGGRLVPVPLEHHVGVIISGSLGSVGERKNLTKSKQDRQGIIKVGKAQ